ncbi:zinc finger protein ZAT1-like [Lycium barbarum]|uniref:zinc finger protein ZAT1-like n=1 Tax=Lycium barbarum TaxID=112863 RepID=UPI00293E5E53|nr:zinc finger protein ZAT1-like [Lycium barbarum]
MSMEKHKCKLCSKKFLSGKALGGHMRSHLIPLPLPPKTPPLNQDSGDRSKSTLSLCPSENQEQEEEILEQKDFYYGLRENPKKSFRIIDPEFLDSESETEWEKNQSRRSKRSRKMFENNEEKVGSLSLFSDSSSEEDIALCLMMLSRDVWRNSNQNGKKCYQCGICYKMFKTSQGLGSHKTIHKNNNYEEELQEKSSKKKFVSVKNIVDKKLHECPFCGKFFQSGQALGGHKRSHFVIMSSSTTGSSSSTKLGGDSLMEYSNSANLPNGFIDLNMPAPLEDNDFSQPDFSAVEFQQEQEVA